MDVLLICFMTASLFRSITAQSDCASYGFTNSRTFASCGNLILNSSFHWSYDQSNSTLTLAHVFGGVTASSPQWVATAINPNQAAMIGSQALVARISSSGTATAYTSQITSKTAAFTEGNLTITVLSISAEFNSGRSELIIYGVVQISNLGTTVNQIWQKGSMSGNTPSIHSLAASDLQSARTLDLLSGATATTVSDPTRRRNVHGVLNAVSWGVLMPLGVIIARYMRVFPPADPAWFYLHVGCQISAYGIGVAGWGTGLKLGSDSEGIEYKTHRNIGITLFSLATLQLFALFLRPNKDNKYRIYWNAYHHAIGYAVISLSIANIYEGFDILEPEKKWKRTYTGIIIALAAVAVVLEVLTWIVVLRRKKNGSDKVQSGAGGDYAGSPPATRSRV